MDWFLYNKDLRHWRVNNNPITDQYYLPLNAQMQNNVNKTRSIMQVKIEGLADSFKK